MSRTRRPAVRLEADGSSQADAPPRVVIDSTDPLDRRRYRCPNGHVRFEPTNSHVFCRSCADAAKHDDSVSPDHYELFDAKTGEAVAWSQVEWR
ncbi:hypothetical protein [Halomarina oriensis]|uniref:Uncharacterized protein n=1 Tax=Halomarina oriensis TaxID=671145 RepID=A0A6B0GSX8_9EURY|nr:hypothetical protein [Halomarina oriensis]MWG34798.1 hypothetical protein [Halomarina oriensis]